MKGRRQEQSSISDAVNGRQLWHRSRVFWNSRSRGLLESYYPRRGVERFMWARLSWSSRDRSSQAANRRIRGPADSREITTSENEQRVIGWCGAGNSGKASWRERKRQAEPRQIVLSDSIRHRCKLSK